MASVTNEGVITMKRRKMRQRRRKGRENEERQRRRKGREIEERMKRDD